MSNYYCPRCDKRIPKEQLRYSPTMATRYYHETKKGKIHAVKYQPYTK